MQISEIERMPFNEVFFFADMFKNDMDKLKKEREMRSTGKKMVDLRTMVG